MSKFIQTNTIKDRLKCPRCGKIVYKLRHKAQDVVCPKCEWASSFIYVDEEE